MATFTPQQDLDFKLRELEERISDAWADYSIALRDLRGKEYEEVEGDVWKDLQRALGELEVERAELRKTT